MSNRACPGIRHLQSTDNAISELAETAKSAARLYYAAWGKAEDYGAEIKRQYEVADSYPENF